MPKLEHLLALHTVCHARPADAAEEGGCDTCGKPVWLNAALVFLMGEHPDAKIICNHCEDRSTT